MFKQSKRKIVAAIMSVLVLLWVGMLVIIYASSYYEMVKQNEQMLQAHAELYVLPQAPEDPMHTDRPTPDGKDRMPPDFDPQSPMYQLSTFYTVAVSYDGTILETINDRPAVHTDDALEHLAQCIVQSDAASGRQDNLVFYKTDKGGYTLVTFMDNTVVNENAMTLFRYTLLFGGVAVILFFFLSVFLARRIVDPLEKLYQKQKQFISDAGHELKTPVSVVSVNAELLSREIGENQWLQNIQYENERMGMLVGQLLTLARAEHATAPMEPLDFSRLVAGEALPFESVAFEKGLALHSDIASGINVAGDGAQLKQIVAILLDNAVQHSRAQGEIFLRLTKEHGFARLSVRNQGDAIPAEQGALLFERFYRVDTARNGEEPHYGLGLAIAKAIAAAHNGQIALRCFDGLVEFSVQIPAL